MLERVWRKGNALALLVGIEIDTAAVEIPKIKLGIKPPYDPEISVIGIYPEETKVEKDTCNPLF